MGKFFGPRGSCFLLGIVGLTWSSSLFAGRINPIGWPNYELRVCWSIFGDAAVKGRPQLFLSSTESAAQSQRSSQFLVGLIPSIRETIVANFSVETTGVHFTGWDRCGTRPGRVDVTLIVGSELTRTNAEDGGEASQVGYDINGANDQNATIVLNIHNPSVAVPKHWEWFEWAADKASIAGMLALHEFGHVAGLHHELDFGDEPSKWETPVKKIVTRYDSNSVMNYDFIFPMMKALSFEFINQGGKFSPTFRKTHVDLASYYFGTFKLNDFSVFDRDQGRVDRYRYRFKLSRGDLHALNCIYRYSKSPTCSPDFDALRNP